MESRYYFSIRYIPECADNELLSGRCISNMHGFLSHERNKQFKNSVGICFPLWNEQTVGNVITFVSTNESILTGISYQPYFSTMMNENLFEISDINVVPDDAEEVRFVFNKTIQKIFNGSKKRRIKRAMKRAQEFGHAFTAISVEEREFELFHEIPISSKSSGCDFVLHIQRQYPVEAEIVQGFNGYGFASNKLWKGTVPLISF
ncbi:type I-F CRISPR-associated endoribonuclease Cas6/Csy4 [Vibrio diazotrophicus]|uniref:Type I-F CRISPR-associated endoribonuclease Cas6/Csy4 n=1 Tax=Vibrio diazotrophicus TaxID=685 RepID=A0ABX4WFZ5_VIBDI|nr:type I-F CRISPR-associated endoribonuclease Cas6/Csy4 [Vibrio diazotrophicus]PNI03193.1 type I-F CRISPR-associated endoribonuclease Cas6/Csy4 [Vibrio diazotrophicus]